jgi:2-aminoadipate transaminase
MTEPLADVLRGVWGRRGVADTASQNIRELHRFKQKYLGMGRTNGDREQQARESAPAGTPIISMGGGLPEHALLPFEDLMQFARTAWANHQPAPLEYGSTVGPSLLKAEIARYLASRRGHRTTTENIFVTTGNQGGIESVAKAYLGVGDVAIVESPLWTSAVNIIKGTGASCVMVGMDSEGIDVAQVAAEIARAGGCLKLIYLQPLHHNPTGVSISFARAEALLRLAAEHGILILADEAYEAFDYDAYAYAHLSTMSGGGHGVLTVHTFSKTLGTGLRLGYVHSTPNLLAALQESRLTQSSGAEACLSSAAATPAQRRTRRLHVHVRAASC